jgi:site-specific recombinase XerD
MSPGDVLIAELTAMWIEQHVANLEAPERYLDSVEVLEAFWTHMRAKRLLPEPFTVLSITNGLIDAFIAWRSAQGASAPTISRDIAALRGPINWGMKNNHLTAAPRIKEVKGRKKRKELEWSPEQVAAILDAAAADEQRRHIHLFAMINLSTHGRTEAILELDADTQIRQGLIYFLRPDEEQTRKRRAIVPICPTLAPWLDGVTGKVIRYRTPTSAKTRAAGGAEWFERPTANIANGFEGVLLAAHTARPDLGLARQAIDADGKPVWLEPRKKLGETKRRPKMVGIGSPNTLRHTIHTWHKRFGVPEAQIDAAAGHSEQGTGASYTHLRPEYLREFTASTEAFWEAVGEFTDTHLRYHRDTNVVVLTTARVKRSA